MSTTTASNGQSGFRAANLGPEELERFAALFVPPWEMPADEAAAAPDPGFKPAPLGALLAAELVPRGSSRPPAMAPLEEKKPVRIVSTMVDVAPPVVQAAPAIAPAPVAKPAIATIEDLEEERPKSKAPLFIGGGLALAAAIVIGVLATRGGSKSDSTDTKSTAAEVKPAEAKKEEPKPAEAPKPAETTAAPEPAKTAEPVATAAPVPTVKPEPPKVVTPPPAPKPPVYTAPATPKPPPAAKPAPKLKEDF